MEELYRDLWVFLYDAPVDLRHYVRDVYDEAHYTDADMSRRYEVFCYLCSDIARLLGGRLPDVIHNRIVLGPVNPGVQRYLEVCGG